MQQRAHSWDRSVIAFEQSLCHQDDPVCAFVVAAPTDAADAVIDATVCTQPKRWCAARERSQDIGTIHEARHHLPNHHALQRQRSRCFGGREQEDVDRRVDKQLTKPVEPPLPTRTRQVSNNRKKVL